MKIYNIELKRVRGFEKISIEQFTKDMKNYLHLIENKKIREVYNKIKKPVRKTIKSAGYDINSVINFYLNPGEKIKIPTGIKAYMLPDEVLYAHIRSSLGFKYKVGLLNQVGVIDSDYYNNQDNEGHIWIGIMNDGKNPLEVKSGEAVAQLVFNKYLLCDGDNRNTGDIRSGGFGSTGK